MDMKAALDQIAEAACRDQLIFPATTEMALKVQHLLDDPDCSIDQLAALVETDPLLATRVVAVANSAIYRHTGDAISDVRNALSCMGFDILRALAAAAVATQIDGMARNSEHRQLATLLWEHTAHVAALSQVIARRVTHVDPDTAFFAGIIHELGGFYLISRAAAYPGLLDGAHGSLRAWGESSEAAVGRALLRQLGASATVLEAIEEMWQGYLAMPPQSLADTLLLADHLAPLESPLSQLAGNGREGIKASIDITLDGETLGGILEESAAAVDSLIAALRV